ncbi:MAG: hypothetical protein FWB87_15730 [Defluviitaleaceae bacterium]|nr:hypothetical protein [Defluviitaleaceae bacterium]
MKKGKNIIPLLGGGAQEKHIYTLGSKTAEGFSNKEKTTAGFAVLSDKKLYCKGGYYNGTGKKHTKITKEESFAMTEYDFAKVVHTKPLWLLCIALVATIVAIYLAVTTFNAWVRFDSTGTQWLFFLISFVITLVLFYVYKKLKRSWLEIVFKNGDSVFNITHIDPLEVQNFQRAMRMVNNGKQVDL